MTEAQFISHGGELAEDMLGTEAPDVSLPFGWSTHDGDGSNGPAVTDPLMLEVTIPAMGDGTDSDAPMWRVSLGDVLDELISWHVFQDGMLDPEELPMFTAIRDALAAQADKLGILIVRSTAYESGIDQPPDEGTR